MYIAKDGWKVSEREYKVKGVIKSYSEGAEKRLGVKTDGKWREEESEGGGGWRMVDGGWE